MNRLQQAQKIERLSKRPPERRLFEETIEKKEDGPNAFSQGFADGAEIQLSEEDSEKEVRIILTKDETLRVEGDVGEYETPDGTVLNITNGKYETDEYVYMKLAVLCALVA